MCFHVPQVRQLLDAYIDERPVWEVRHTALVDEQEGLMRQLATFPRRCRDHWVDVCLNWKGTSQSHINDASWWHWQWFNLCRAQWPPCSNLPQCITAAGSYQAKREHNGHHQHHCTNDSVTVGPRIMHRLHVSVWPPSQGA